MGASESGEAITRRSGSNLALSFVSLDAQRRSAMSVFYAFCRVVDDIADDAGLPKAEKLRRLGEWRRQIELCYTGVPESPLAKELAPVLRRHLIPPEYPLEIIAGVSMDVEPPRYETWEQLRQYCYRVASCVGLASIEIFGYRHTSARQFAELLGLALQTTNILRDVRQDLANGRIYLPEEDLRRAGYSRAELERGIIDERALHAFRLMGERSEHFYAAAARALHPEDRPAMRAAQVMRGVYYDVLRRIRARGFDVWRHDGRLPGWRKAWLVCGAILGERRRHAAPRASARVAVLGAGVAGLAAAVDLARAGHRVTLVEALGWAGGRAHSFRHAGTGDIVDNGQHVLMGCYRQTLEFLDTIGSRGFLREPGGLDVPFLSEGGGVARLRARRWPCPLHVARALFGFAALGTRERLRAAEPLVAAVADRSGQRWRASTAAEWLQACGQSDNAVRSLWGPFCAAALNEPVGSASAALFGEVVRRALVGRASDARVLFSRVGLSRLLVDRAIDIIAACGGEVRLGRAARRLVIREGRVAGVEVDGAGELVTDAVVSALPWGALRALLPSGSDLGRRVEPLRGAPIVGIHLWFDREVCPEPFAGLLDSPIHWIFNRNAVCDLEKPSGPSVTLVISGAYDHVGAPSDDLVRMAVEECRRFLPAAREASVLHEFVYKARDATLQARPEMLPHRPGPETAWPNLFLAGDWTDTGLPSTIEGAVVSGRRAAALVG
ncbi:MAG: FAD-dependent oxidoreductase [Verrucomicrobiae bacterium]|nr:FAD-dependent oxidoreductase [Verrucomicrobiae bacterium]